MNSTRKHYISIAALLLIASCFYWPTLKGAFVYDEVESVLQNKALFDAPVARILFTSDYFSLSREVTYRPIVTLSYLIDDALWGMTPWGWRLTNLLWHLLCVGLLYLLIHITYRNHMAAFLAAMLFALHPAHVEAVAGVGFREDLIVATSLLALAIVYQLWNNGALSTAKSLLLATTATILGQFSKENAFVAPALVAALVFTGTGLPHDEKAMSADRQLRPPLLFIGFVSCVTVLIFIVRFFLMRNQQVPETPPLGGSYLAMWARAPWIWLSHGFLPVIIPFHLRPDRLVYPEVIGIFRILSGWVFAATFVAFIYWMLRKQRTQSFGILWYVLLWLPTLNIIPLMVPAAERYTYVPDLGLAMLIGAWLSKGRLAVEKKIISYAVVAVICLFLGILTYRQVGRWESIESLWNYQLSIDSRSVRARHSLAFDAWTKSQDAYQSGNAQMGRQYMQRAVNLSREAYRIAPNDKNTLINYGIFLYYSGNVREAENIFQKIVRQLPNDRTANEMLKRIKEKNAG